MIGEHIVVHEELELLEGWRLKKRKGRDGKKNGRIVELTPFFRTIGSHPHSFRHLVSHENRVWKFVVYNCRSKEEEIEVWKIYQNRQSSMIEYFKSTFQADLIPNSKFYEERKSEGEKMLARCETSWLRKVSLGWRKSADFSNRIGRGGETFD